MTEIRDRNRSSGGAGGLVRYDDSIAIVRSSHVANPCANARARARTVTERSIVKAFVGIAHALPIFRYVNYGLTDGLIFNCARSEKATVGFNFITRAK